MLNASGFEQIEIIDISEDVLFLLFPALWSAVVRDSVQGVDSPAAGSLVYLLDATSWLTVLPPDFRQVIPIGRLFTEPVDNLVVFFGIAVP